MKFVPAKAKPGSWEMKYLGETDDLVLSMEIAEYTDLAFAFDADSRASFE